MKALTVQNPWAWAIIHGGKGVENRAQGSSHRGLVAIHAGLAWSEQGAADSRVLDVLLPRDRRDWPQFPMGVVIGVADLVDTHRAEPGCCDSPWADPIYRGKQAVHYVLKAPQPLAEPVPARGALWMWTLADDVERAVREQLPTPAAPL